MSSPTEGAVRAYFAAWADRDATARRRHLESCFHERGRVCLPGQELRGREQVRGAIEAFHARSPDFRTRLLSVVDAHDGVFRVRTSVERPDGTTFGEYLDVGEGDAEGLITTIYVFREPMRDAE